MFQLVEEPCFATCPTCARPDAEVGKAVTAKGNTVYAWNCPTCGEFQLLTGKSPDFSLTTAEVLELDELKKKLSELEQTIERTYARHTSGAEQNPAMDIGGIRSRSKRQKQQLFNRYTREARETGNLVNRRKQLERKIRSLENRPKHRRQRWNNDVALLRWWDGLKPGDTFNPGAGDIAIAKKNRASIVLVSGTKWTIHEVLGMKRERIKEVRAYL